MSNRSHRIVWRYWIVAYLVSLLVVGGLFAAGRQLLIRRYDTDRSLVDDWQRWRDDVARQPETDSVYARKVPRSEMPPALWMIRDHFLRSLGIGLGLWTGVFVMLAIAMHAVLFAPPFTPRDDEDLDLPGPPRDTASP